MIVGMFVATWAIALAVWRLGRIEERWSAHLCHGRWRAARDASPDTPTGFGSRRSTTRSTALRERGLRLSMTRQLVLEALFAARRAVLPPRTSPAA